MATSHFLCFYFLTNEGLELIRAASPGGAGRNRTLGLEALANIPVPVPDIHAQLWFDGLQALVYDLRNFRPKPPLNSTLCCLPCSIKRLRENFRIFSKGEQQWATQSFFDWSFSRQSPLSVGL